MLEQLQTTLQSVISISMVEIFRAIIIFILGLILASIISRVIHSLVKTRWTAHQAYITRQATYWLIFSIFTIMTLRHLGFDLSVLMGAAGILTVAIGFASQTSASNIISGLFLLGEKAFSVGDTIQVDGIEGEVISIDLLSAKIRTFDNLFVRIPNETLLKSKVITNTRYPIRRFSLFMGVAYKEDINRVIKVLMQVADENPICLDEPKPVFIHRGFGESSVDFQFSVWCTRENWLALRNSIQLEIKQAFDRENIEIPFPHRTIYTGSQTDPMPIRLHEAEITTSMTRPEGQAEFSGPVDNDRV